MGAQPRCRRARVAGARDRDPAGAGGRARWGGGLRGPAPRRLPRPLVVPGRVVPSPDRPARAPLGDAVGRDRPARARRGGGRDPQAARADPPPHLRRHLGSPPEHQPSHDGGGRGACRSAPRRGPARPRAAVALRARLPRRARHRGGFCGAVRRGHGGVLRLPARGEGLGAPGARRRGICYTRGGAPCPRLVVTVSIVVVNWNAGAALDGCLESLAADGLAGRDVVLVDNDSTDGSTTRARARHPWARIVETGLNLGFAGGANRGAAAARGEVLCFLNPDARVRPGAVQTLVDTLGRVPGAGIAGGGLVDDAGGWQPAAGRFGPVRHLMLDTTPGRLGARLRRAPYRVDWVYGTFMAVRRDLFRQLGGFDPRYFLYGEDLDLCYRAARLGSRTIHVPAARAVHGTSLGTNVSAAQRFGLGREAEVVKGEMRFYAARRAPHDLVLFRAVAACKFGLKAALAAAVGRRDAAAAYARVVRACVAFDPLAADA
ncbi:MAG: glycosyltransferase [Deltaproteobacteria bacterium]|nr:MAG: glycosyltransferase [Deltaproteobacteria bacterium]